MENKWASFSSTKLKKWTFIWFINCRFSRCWFLFLISSMIVCVLSGSWLSMGFRGRRWPAEIWSYFVVYCTLMAWWFLYCWRVFCTLELGLFYSFWPYINEPSVFSLFFVFWALSSLCSICGFLYILDRHTPWTVCRIIESIGHDPRYRFTNPKNLWVSHILRLDTVP